VKISGTSVLHATPDKVWAAITDPAVLAGVLPGCQVLNPLGDNHFGLTVHMGVAAIKGTYAGEVKLYDLVAPSSLTMRAAGAGAPGTIDTTVAVTLSDAGDGTTRLDYDADAAVGGMVGGVGQRVLTSVAKKTAGLFFASIDDVLTGKKPVTGQTASAAVPPAPGAVAPVGAAASGESPFGATLAAPGAVGPAGVGPAALVAAAVTGAVAMAVGVLIGARIARRR
jgi:carbon monoxide dehydrogenase subunit G